MAFDLELIQRVFNEGVTRCYEMRCGDANDGGAVDMANAASAEFAKLRKAIEEAPSKRLEWSDFNRGLSLDDYAPPGIDVNAYADELEARLTGARVLLVKADD